MPKKIVTLLLLLLTLRAGAVEVGSYEGYDCWEWRIGRFFVGPNFMQTPSPYVMDTGYVIGGGLAARFLDWARAELEFSFRDNDMRSIRGTSNFLLGYISTSALLADLYIDLDFGCFDCFFPYVGGGVGGAWSRRRILTTSNKKPQNTNRDGAAYQAIAGVEFVMSETADLAIDYRFLYGPWHIKNHSVAISFLLGF